MSSTRSKNQSLQWTRPLLDELCDEVRMAVERFGDEDVDSRPEDLDEAIAACEKVAGSLAMMEFESGQLIADAMGLALHALKSGKTRSADQAVNSVLEATATLPDYLDYLESTQLDAPIIVLPTVNELRATAGEKPIDEARFFQPDLSSASLPEVAEEAVSEPNETRRRYQHALRGMLLNNEDAEALSSLSEAALILRDQVSLPSAVRRVGWAAAGLCDALRKEHVATGSATTRLFARLDVLIKNAIEQPEDAALVDRADELCRGFLFQLALSRSEAPLAVEVYQAFDLGTHAPEHIAQAKVFLAGRNRALFAAVTQAAREDLARIKDVLGSQLEQERDPELLQQQTALLESVGESLGMLGLEHLAGRVKKQASRLNEMGSDPEDPTLLLVARELLVVESQLEESFGLAAQVDLDDGAEDDLDLLPPTEQRRVVRQLVKEALEDLAHAKHLLDAVNRQKADAGAVGEAQAILGRIAGVLYLSEFDEAAAMLEAASRVAADHLGDGVSGDVEALDILAETLTVSEFYLESLCTNDERGEPYLHSARDRLAALGYWKDESAHAEPVEEAGAADADLVVDDELAAQGGEPDEEQPEALEELGDLEGMDELEEGEPVMEFETDDPVEPEFDLQDQESRDELETEGAGEPADENAPELDADLIAGDEPLEEDIGAIGSDLSLDTDEPDGDIVEPDDFADDLDLDDLELDEDPALDEASGVTSAAQSDEQADSSSGAGAGSAFDDFDIVEIFLEEFDQELESLNELVPKWRENPADEETTVTIRRAFHSLKGSGRMAGAMEIGEFAWQIENMLNRVLDRQIQATPEVTGLVAKAITYLPSMRARLSGEGAGEVDEASCVELARQAEMASEGKLAEPVETRPVPPELEDLDPTLIELMIKELSDNLEAYDQWLVDADESGHVPPIDESLVRIVHTMKGTMRLAPIGDETETAQILESYLEELSLCVAPPSRAGLLAMVHCSELFAQRLARLRCEVVEDEIFETASLARELRELHNQAHRERTGDTPAELPPLDVSTGFQAADQEVPQDEDLEVEAEAEFESGPVEEVESEDDEDVFSSDVELDGEVDEADLDVFDLEEDEGSVPEADHAPDDEKGDEIESDRAIVSADEFAELTDQEDEDDDSAEDSLTADEQSALVEDDVPGDEEELLAEEREPETAIESEADLELADDLELEDAAELKTSDESEQDDEPVDQVTAEDLAELEAEIDPEEHAGESDEVVEDAAVEETDSDGYGEDEAKPIVSHFVPERPTSGESDDAVEPAPTDERLVEVDYSEVNEDLLEAFLEEGQELLEHADDVLQKWRETPDDKNLVTALQRDLHTIKGSARMVGLNPIGQVAHVMEELLEGIAAGLKDTTKDRIDALEVGCDHLHSMLEAVIQREPMPVRSLTDMFAEQAEDIEEAGILPELEEQTESATQTVERESDAARAETLRVPSSLIDELVNYAGEISIFRSRLEQQVSVFRNNVGEVDETVIRLRDQLRKLEIETEAQILARYEREHGPADEAFDPLELDRYSTIQQLSRALAESVNDLTSLTGILDDATRQSETLLMQQSRVNTELQEGLMQARMVSFNTLLPRFRRVVRNAAREVEKSVQLRVKVVGEGELDRNVLDRITAPLEHLLRNAVSHGIELPEQRRAQGKPDTGTITIEVGREATELVMRVSDDGAGLNLDAIRARAIERGLIGADEELSEAELSRLIFQSGFTTAEQVSELAGRGIGMDVVANEVRQIGGSVSAQSETGKGAQFIIRIPLSLTVMQAIMVRAADRQFAIPLQAVRGVTRILADEWLREIDTPDPLQEYAGEQYPLLELEPQLDLASEEIGGSTLSLLMIEAGEQRAALRVSDLMGHREIVIKPVGPQISSIPGILGGTITGDGQVVPILDMGPLIRRAFEKDIVPGRGAVLQEKTEEVKRTPLVMVVDDSITMRRVTSRVLEHRGLEVVTARDGLDAVEAMFERVPDLILLDIEMPRMDGYELASHVRNDPRLKEVPMMMITSRSGEKHRQRARELGVNDYLAKPYQESDLVQHVFDLLEMTVPQG